MGVTLQELLDARDRRADYQKRLLAHFSGNSLMVFTVVWPGPDKTDPDAARLFSAGLIALIRLFRRLEIKTSHFETFDYLKTGGEIYVCAPVDALFLKHETCVLEESAPYGRLWDMDVMDATGAHISREAVGFPERGCIVCGKPGRACASRRLHPLDETLAAAHALAGLLPDRHKPNTEDRA